jgi:hypothetical protein
MKKLLTVALLATQILVNAAPVALSTDASTREKKSTLTNLSDLISNVTVTKDSFDSVKKTVGDSRATFTPKNADEKAKADALSKYAKGKLALDVTLNGLKPIKSSIALFNAFSSLVSDADVNSDVTTFINGDVFPRLADAKDTVQKLEEIAILLKALIPDEPKPVAIAPSGAPVPSVEVEEDPFA